MWNEVTKNFLVVNIRTFMYLICSADMVDEAFKKDQATKFLSKVNICDEIYNEQSPFLKDFKVHV